MCFHCNVDIKSVIIPSLTLLFRLYYLTVCSVHNVF